MKAPPIPPLTKAYGKYGAQMGRRNWYPISHDGPLKMRLQRLRFIDGDYDQGGAYWGGPATIYRATSICPDLMLIGSAAWSHEKPIQGHAEVFVRADSRDEAKVKIRELIPTATFYR